MKTHLAHCSGVLVVVNIQFFFFFFFLCLSPPHSLFSGVGVNKDAALKIMEIGNNSFHVMLDILNHILTLPLTTNSTQSAFTCSKLTIETLEEVVKYVQS